MQVERKQLAALFVELGFATASNWTKARLQTKLKDLPELVKEDDAAQPESKELRTLLKEVVAAVDAGTAVEITGDDVGPETSKKPATKAGGKTNPKKPEGKGSKADKGKADKPKKPGVIATIIEVLKNASKDKPATKEKILKECKKKFPEREEASMKSTIASQVPSGLKAEKSIVVKKDGNGGFWL